MTDEPVSAEDRGFLYGDGLFETVRVEDGRARFLDRHLRRFERSARGLAFPEEVMEAGLETLESLQERRDGLWRVTVTRPGDGAFGGGVGSVRLRHRALPGPINGEGVTITCIEGFYFPGDRLAEHKTTSWIRSAEAKRRARERDFDEALMVSSDGRVGEASAANVFLRIGGGWVTPRMEGILPGVVRSVVLDSAREQGIEVEERVVLVGDLQTCEAMALTSAGRLVTPVAEVDGMALDVGLVRDLAEAI